MKKYFWLAVLVVFSGCTVTKIKTPGWELNRTSFLQKVEIPRVTVGPDGTATLEGYKNDGGNDAVAAITAAAVSAAIKSVAPIP